MNKKIILWSLAFLFLIVLTEYAYAVADVITDDNITGSKTVNRNVVITKNGRLNVLFYWESSTNAGIGDAKTWIQYGPNTTGLDDSRKIFTGGAINITTACGSNAFKIVNLSNSNATGNFGNNSNTCFTGTGHAHGCLRDNAKKAGFSYVYNLSTEDSCTGSCAGQADDTRERFMFGIRSCNVSGAFDISANRSVVTAGTYTFNNWFNITVAKTLFMHPAGAPSDADRKTYYANTTTPAANQTVNLSVRITNEEDIKFHIFSTNVTGSWKNRTASNVRVSGAADTNIVNWTTLKINTSCAASACTNTKKVGWRFYANDSSRLFNTSSINIITPGATAGASCTPPGSGDWVITDTCYKSNEKINLASGGRVLILAGGLLICDRTNVTAAGSTPIMIILGEGLTKLVTKGASNC